jgi:putative tricarboxylic transport membrane protein
MSDQSSDNLALEKSSAKIFHRKDLWLASIIIAFGAFMYYEATKFPSAPLVLGDTLNADVFPRILVVMLIILACILPIEFKITPEKILKIDKDRNVKVIPITWITIIMLLTITLLSGFLGAVLTIYDSYSLSIGLG